MARIDICLCSDNALIMLIVFCCCELVVVTMMRCYDVAVVRTVYDNDLNELIMIFCCACAIVMTLLILSVFNPDSESTPTDSATLV